MGNLAASGKHVDQNTAMGLFSHPFLGSCRPSALSPQSSILLLLLLTFLAPSLVAAQAQCGSVQSITFPVDPTFFRIAQDFGASSPRHEGEYHTGEDWTGPRGHTLGEPVRAIASGRVTYASENGWGRDAGVVIIEHKLPDGATLYSMYGHLVAAPDTPFPTPLTCVKGGDVIGAIADVRPAPHVHFEIRSSRPDIPGPGYDWQAPTLDGWLQPSRVVRNWQTWLLPAEKWHFGLSAPDGPAVTPLTLDDHSTIFIDGGRLGRLTADGRSLWRTALDKPAVGLASQERSVLVFFADGSAQAFNREGTPGKAWSVAFQPDSAPLSAGALLVFHTADGSLAAVDPAAQALRWTLPISGMPLPDQWWFSGGLIGVISRGELLTISPDGRLLGRARLRNGAALATGIGGGLLSYSEGGLWTISAEGIWSLALPGIPASSGSGSAVARGGGGYFVFDGATLGAYDATGSAAWQVALPNVTGRTTLDLYGDILLLTGAHGDIIALRAATGQGCASARVYGDDFARPWHQLGDDGLLRLAIADQIMALDWKTFLAGCG